MRSWPHFTAWEEPTWNAVSLNVLFGCDLKCSLYESGSYGFADLILGSETILNIVLLL